MQAAALMTAQHQKQPVGLYLHIPYCARKCRYCDFTSFCGLTDTQDTYVDRVIREMQSKAPSLQGRSVDTLFIGGGTPSLLRPGPRIRSVGRGATPARRFAFAA